MRKQIERMKRTMIIIVIIQAALLFFFRAGLQQGILSASIILVLEILALLLLFDRFQNVSQEQATGVRSVLGTAASEAYLTGEIGLVIYDENYVVTWMSELFKKREIDRVGKKLLTWVPEVNDLIAGTSDRAHVMLDDKMYEITRKQDAPVLFFKDVTLLTTYKKKYENEHLVLGLANFDNFEETTQYEDETNVANISANIRAPFMEYCTTHGILTKRLNTYRYLLVLNEKTFTNLANDHFSILNRVRKAANKMDVSITLSMVFARGTSDPEELDEMVSNLMDLAQTRGGDQVAVQVAGQEVKYFGGSSEAAEKRSRVRVRVMSHALRDLIQKSSNVVIVGHKMADFDCIGSAICLAEMVNSLHKQVVIVAKTGGIEEKLKAAMDKHESELKERVTFVTEGEAVNQLTDKTLVIMTDHHSSKQSNGARVLENAKKIVVIDHHRRSTDIGVKPVLIYIEAGASSTCELLTEMIPYVSRNVDISELEATMMLTGMVVDTQRWRVRTGARTYEAAAKLRELGADPIEAYGYLKDTFDEYTIKAIVGTSAERYDNGIVIASVKDRTLTRSLMSQVADSLLGVEGVKASFVIANTSDTETAISARSGGNINVQMIMEKMGGGGHLAAAALQRTKGSIDALKEELIENIDHYFEEEKQDESHS